MRETENLGRQLSDLVAYIVLPLLCLVLPINWGSALLRRCAGKGWVLATRSRLASETAAKLIYIPNHDEWRRRWRLVELTEARDTWFCRAGRVRGLVKGVSVDGPIPEAKGRLALIGLHWGPSVLALEVFRQHGLAPRFVHRPVDIALRRRAPFQYAYLQVLVQVIRRCCAGRPIVVPGAKASLQDALQAPGTPVLLMDAPPTSGRRVLRVSLLERTVTLAADGIELLTEAQAECVFFALGLDADGNGKQLDYAQALRPDTARELATGIAHHFNRHVLQDSAQWRLWHAAGQLFDLEESA